MGVGRTAYNTMKGRTTIMQTPINNIAPGKTVNYHGEPCLVLEHRKDGTLMLHLDQTTLAFGDSNNYATSHLRAYLNDPYLRSITDGNPDEIITRTVDLTALNGSREYGTCDCKVAPLTLDEIRKYHDILPLPESLKWSVTPWSTETDTWVMGLNFDGILCRYNCGSFCGCYPAFVVSPSLTVEAEGTNPLEQYSTCELWEELSRRIGK